MGAAFFQGPEVFLVKLPEQFSPTFTLCCILKDSRNCIFIVRGSLGLNKIVPAFDMISSSCQAVKVSSMETLPGQAVFMKTGHLGWLALKLHEWLQQLLQQPSCPFAG